MSTDRANSGVSNLRAMFENQGNDAQRSSSPSGRSSAGDGERKVSKVRASFVSVDRPGEIMNINGATDSSAVDSLDSGLKKENDPTTDNQQNSNTISTDAQKSTLLSQTTQPVSEPVNGETATQATLATPSGHDQASTNTATQEKSSLDTPEHDQKEKPALKQSINGSKSEAEPSILPPKDTPADNPDKVVTGVEEEPGQLKPANPTDAVTTSVNTSSTPKSVTKKASRASIAQKSTASTSSPASKQPKLDTPSKGPKAKPSLNFRQSKGPASPAASKISAPKSPARPTTSDSKASEKSSTSRGGRSSLTAQTASSAAKSKPSGSEPGKTTGAEKSLPIRTKPRSPTRPAKLPSHLTAPTASSAAKHDSTKPAPKSTIGSRVAGTSSVRSSLGDLKSSTHSAKSGINRSNSTATRPAPRTSNAKLVVADEGFLARMMRPTASSASKAHEKADEKPTSSKPITTKPRAGTGPTSKTVPKAEKAKVATTTAQPVSRPAENGHVRDGQSTKPAAATAVPATATPVKDTSSATAPAQDSTPAQSESASKQDETTIDSSIAGIETPSVDAPTIR
ncbi:hypothetical protein B9Z65_8575 [Elsinoe australis]|uniref:Uncharacterized protein n=1 Tax=Elsinoe australis TaxID=40998 RepID=A0A2P7YE67_9PEZI|nr:hypothetical protein B9Z65_8575 [Elsinoe australis]